MSRDEAQLCDICQAIDIVTLIENLNPYETRTIPHQASYAELVQAAASCRLCSVLLASLFREDNAERKEAGSPDYFGVDYFRRSSTPKPTVARSGTGFSEITRTDSRTSIVQDVVSWHYELDKGRDAVGFQIEVKAESTLNADFAIEYAIYYRRPSTTDSLVEGPKPRPLVLSSEQDLGLGIPNRPIVGFPSFNVYASWVKECASGSKHVRCARAEPVDLPTRLIDVGAGAGSSTPRLVTTAGMKGQYLTLSHCWGKYRVIVTTSKNIKSHESGIPFAQFPKLFQDAMLVTRILGFRYLWIDTLCIVQDSVADWEQECTRMGGIYLNSVCTLAAPSASHSETGLLAQRSPSDLRSCRLEARRDSAILGQVTIGPPSSELKEHASVLSSRAWVLQEQILSPRTLNFGRNGMYFQCLSHEQLESYHHALPPERVTTWRTSRASDLPKTLISMAAQDPVYWYFIARQYSFRRLTYGDDKLPALAGLAEYVSRQSEEDENNDKFGQYWAGLWSKDLGRGLIWTSDTPWDPTNALHKVDENIPSWSWASQNTPVEWKVLRDFRPEFDCLSGIIDLMSDHQFGRVDDGRLELNATTKSASFQRQIVGKAILLCDMADTQAIAELTLDHTAGAFFKAAWPDADTSFSCRLLLLGQAESTLYGMRWYALVLVPLGHTKYRRIGVASSLGHGTTHARSLTAELSYNWFGDAIQESVVLV